MSEFRRGVPGTDEDWAGLWVRTIVVQKTTGHEDPGRWHRIRGIDRLRDRFALVHGSDRPAVLWSGDSLGRLEFAGAGFPGIYGGGRPPSGVLCPRCVTQPVVAVGPEPVEVDDLVERIAARVVELARAAEDRFG